MKDEIKTALKNSYNDRIKEIKKIWEDAESRKRICKKKFSKKYNKDHRYNWEGIVGYEFAHCNDSMYCKEIDPCPFCLGTGEMPVIPNLQEFILDENPTKICPICHIKGLYHNIDYSKHTAWYKYGIFDVREESQYI